MTNEYDDIIDFVVTKVDEKCWESLKKVLTLIWVDDSINELLNGDKIFENWTE